MTSTKERPGAYCLPIQFLHWGMALAILMAFALGWTMDSLPKGSDLRSTAFGLHKSLGMLVLMMLGLRVLWRLFQPSPHYPAAMPPWQRRAALGAHLGLYLLMMSLPLLGFLMSNAADRPTMFFGLFEIPRLIGPDKGLKAAFEEGHEILAAFMIALIGLHALAALWHQFVVQDGLIGRMLPGRA
jgi:cytochrome b561